MGKVRSDYIKNNAEEFFSIYSDKVTLDFESNKNLLQEYTSISSNKLRNRIAGYLIVLKKNENKIIISPTKNKKPRDRKRRNKRNMGRRKRKNKKKGI